MYPALDVCRRARRLNRARGRASARVCLTLEYIRGVRNEDRGRVRRLCVSAAPDMRAHVARSEQIGRYVANGHVRFDFHAPSLVPFGNSFERLRRAGRSAREAGSAASTRRFNPHHVHSHGDAELFARCF